MRPVFAALCAVLLLGSTNSCANLTPTEQQLLDCGSQAVQQQLPGLLQQVNGLLNSGNINWQDGLDQLLTTAGSAVVCAVQVAVSDLEHSSNLGTLGTVAVTRGEAWLMLHKNLVKPPNALPATL